MKSLKELFKQKKFLRIFIPLCVVLIIVGIALYSKLSDKGIAVEVKKAETGTVEQYYDTTGTLTSGNMEKYYIYEGVVVKEVNVSVGDTVSKGDILATFDTSSMNSVVSEKKAALDSAQKTYNDAVSGKNDTKAKLREIDEKIADLEAQKKKMENEAPSESVTRPEIEIPDSMQEGLTDEQIEELKKALEEYADSSQTTLPDFSSGNSSDTAAIDAQIKILESQKTMTSSGQYDTLISAYKKNVESAKADYDAAVAEKKALDDGWVATADGKVGDVYLTAGKAYTYVEDKSQSADIMSMISGGSSDSSDMSAIMSMLTNSNSSFAKKGLGMIVDYYGGYKINFSLGKYDVQSIEVGMPAIVTYTDYKYAAKVTYMSSRADSSSDVVSSMMSGMMGSSSSGTGSAESLLAEATIEDPDSNLIIGFDAKLSILTGKHENVLVIPVESLLIEEGKKYVYIYDNGTAVKTEIETGISSETEYEVTGGLKPGASVIINSSEVTDGARVYVK